MKDIFLQDMIDILDPYVGTSEGNDGFIYGNYVEWPLISDLDEDTIVQLLEYFDISLPFGKNVFISDIIFNELDWKLDRAKRTLIKDSLMYDLDELCLQEFIFPSLVDLRDIVNIILKSCGVPEGTINEHDYEMPESLKFWQEDNEFEYYNEHGIEFLNFKNQLKTIEERVKNENDNITIKALILSAFIFTESFTKSIISKLLPEIVSEITNVGFRKRILKSINNDIKTKHGREDLFWTISGKKLPPVNNWDLRNSLAHDIGVPVVKGTCIEYLDKKNIQNTITFDEIFENLLKYGTLVDELIK